MWNIGIRSIVARLEKPKTVELPQGRGLKICGMTDSANICEGA